MTSRSIPVDLFNPGQVFACLGLMEIAQEFFGHSEGRFDDGDPTDVRFELHGDGREDAIAKALGWLGRAEVVVLVPEGRADELEAWKLDAREREDDEPFPIQPPDKPAPMPALISADGTTVTVSSWGDETGRDKAKWWAGARGQPGASVLEKSLRAIRETQGEWDLDPFACRSAHGGSLRVDPRGEYVPSPLGFSVNEHKSTMGVWTFPFVNVLAAIGLENARPMRPDPRDKLFYRYGVATGALVDVALHRAVLGCAGLPHAMRVFEIHLDWPGQENQARSITSVTETTRP